MEKQLPIVVYSHLRWNSMCQRPQQLLSRIARTRPVYYFEETLPADPQVPDSIELRYPLLNLVVIRPILEHFSGPFDLDRLCALTKRFLRWQKIERHVAWIYTPMAYPLAKAMEPELVVYDCMDELSASADAPATLRRREAELLREADLVFAGGASLYRAKREQHPYVRCFPSSVDAAHFRPGPDALQDPPDQAALARPRLGYSGALDERLDRDLLDAVAAARPDWEFVLIGPVAGIDVAALPQRRNLHYLGERPYDALPSYVAGWDACLLPFARNGATRFISPGKTLEYMAAEKPIVSTSIRDVVQAYADAIEVADDPADFVAACERVLAETPAQRASRVAVMREFARRSSWDDTVEAMLGELRAAQRSRMLAAVPIPLPGLSPSPAPAAS